MTEQPETVVVQLANGIWRAVNPIGQTGHGRTPLDAIVNLLEEVETPYRSERRVEHDNKSSVQG